MPYCGTCGALYLPEAKACPECGTRPTTLATTVAAPTQRSRSDNPERPFETTGVSPRAWDDRRGAFPATQASPEPAPSLGETLVGGHAPLGLAGLDRSKTVPSPPANLKGTMMGMPSPLAAPERASPAGSGSPFDPPVDLRGTMVGMPRPEVRPNQADPTFAKVTLGFEPETPGNSLPGRPSAASPSSTVPETPSPLELAAHFGTTQLGMPQLLGRPEVQVPGGARRSPTRSGTLHGVAQPGIAPTHRPPPAAAEASPLQPLDRSSRPTSTSAPGALGTRRHPGKVIGWFVGALALAAVVGAGLGRLSRPGHTVRVVRFETDAEQGDFIVLEGQGVPPGTNVRVGSQSVALGPGGARIAAGRRLSTGMNEIPITIIPPGAAPRSETLLVPVAFRVDTSVLDLETNAPRAKVSVSAPAGAQVTIDGLSVPLEGGLATHTVELGAAQIGFDKATFGLDRAVPIVVRHDGQDKRSTAQVSITETPLSLTFPPDRHVLVPGPLVVEGLTSPGARVFLGNVPVVANAQGAFRAIVDAPEPGVFELRASTPSQVQRRAELMLMAESKWRAPPVAKTPVLAAGTWGSFRGKVIEIRPRDNLTRFVFQPEVGCAKPPCLVAVSFAQPMTLAPGDLVVVTGRFLSLDPPTVLAEFVDRL